ncbi:MAG: M48 family metallopeptidase [Alphaproteobacteria bacterium]|jgi:predicted metal-dependent hydrolase|nr:M48 family metallopeptidase [Alphaproteobacteria bacterium]
MYNVFDIAVNNNLYIVKVIKRKNAKRITLRVNLKTKQPTVSIPYKTTYTEAITFFQNNHAWVENQLEKISSNKNQPYYFTNLSEIPIYGETYKIVKTVAKKNNIAINKETKEIYLKFKDFTNEALIEKTFIKFLKQIATLYFYKLSLSKAQQIHTTFSKVSVSDTTSKWGSCSLKKNLQYNYRLIMSPNFVIDYVVSHEVAHLLEFNHKENFWNLLNQLTPYKKAAELWLKNYGKSLY